MTSKLGKQIMAIGICLGQRVCPVHADIWKMCACKKHISQPHERLHLAWFLPF